MAIDIPADWAKGKDEYFALTKEKKPRPSFLKFFKTTHTGLTKSIQAVAAFDSLPSKDKTYKKLKGLVDKYKKESQSYIKLLNSLIEEEDKLTAKGMEVTDEGLKPAVLKTNRLKGLKMLKAKLQNYASHYDVALTLRKSMEEGVGKMELFQRQFEVGMKNGFNRFAAASKTVKATPTVEVWNREFSSQDAVRSLTTAMSSYRAMEKQIEYLQSIDPNDTTALTSEQDRMLKLTKVWFQKLSPWADGNGEPRKMNDTRTKEELLAELKKCSTMVKQCKSAFGM